MTALATMIRVMPVTTAEVADLLTDLVIAGEAMRLFAERALYFVDGKLVKDGAPADVLG